MKKILLIFTLLFFGVAFSQSVAVPLKPSINQEKLIDEFLKVSNYKKSIEEYSLTFLYSKMNQTINGKSVRILDKSDLDNIIKNFDFEKFKKTSIYNTFSQISENNLKSMINLYNNTNGELSKRNAVFFTDQIITGNLINQLNRMVEDVIKKKGI